MSGPELCPKCKGLHYKNSPCIIRATKSTGGAESQKHGGKVGGGQIDTHHPSKASGLAVGEKFQLAGVVTGPVEQTKRSVGRPKIITDMKAYKAAKAREYRARKAK